MTQQDAAVADNVVKGKSMILISYSKDNTLFDYGTTHSFVSHVFASKLNVSLSTLEHALAVSTTTGDQINTRIIYYDCLLEIGRSRMSVNFILLHMNDFDVILGMDWLSKYRVILDCFNKMVGFNLEGFIDVCVVGKRMLVMLRIISAITAEKLLRNGCDIFIAFISSEK